MVIINRVDYKARMQDILSDNMKFDLVNNTALKETLSKETKITNLLKELKQDEVISEQQFDELKPIGSRPGILYGLPKGLVTRCNFSCNLQRNPTPKGCKFVTNVWYVKNTLANCDGNMYLPILHLRRVELHCKLHEKLHRVTGP